MKTVAIVAARMSSTRLPGKVLRPILGTPMLQRMMDRLRRCRQLNEIVIATSENSSDDAIVNFAREKGYLVGRGSENDVLGRYHKVASERKADVIVRLTGDCPLIDPEVTDLVIERHHASKNNDLTCNVIERTYPRGFDTEVLSWPCLDRLNRETADPLYREHVTNYVYDYQEKFNVENVTGARNHSNLRICVDTEADFELVTALYESLYPKNPNFGFREIMELIEQKPELREINAAVEQAKIFKRRTRA